MKSAKISELEAKVLKKVHSEIDNVNKNLIFFKIRVTQLEPDKFRLFIENQNGMEEDIAIQSLTVITFILGGMVKGITLGLSDVTKQMDDITKRKYYS